MSNVPTPALPSWQADRLPVLLDALDGVVISAAEQRTLEWLTGWEEDTVKNLAAVITRARQAGPPDRVAGG